MLFFCCKEAIDKIALIFVLGKILHTFHETLYSKICSDCEVIKFVEFRQVRIFPEQFVECWDLSDLELVNRVNVYGQIQGVPRRSISSRFQRSVTCHPYLWLAP